MASRRTLVIGLGNLSRRDDGLGWYAVNAVRARLGRPPLDEYDDGFDTLGHEVDAIFVPQLAPELVDLLADYDRVIVVDARVTGEDQVTVAEADASLPSARLLSHEMFLAELAGLARGLYGARFDAYVVSAKGTDYDFGSGLSPALQQRLPEVVARVLELAMQ